MENYTIREVNSEIIVFLDYNHPTKLSALKAAARLMAAEVIREEHRISRQQSLDDRNQYVEQHNDGQPETRIGFVGPKDADGV